MIQNTEFRCFRVVEVWIDVFGVRLPSHLSRNYALSFKKKDICECCFVRDMRH